MSDRPVLEDAEIEIELTDDMIVAGRSEIVLIDVEHWNGAEIVENVFRAMISEAQTCGATLRIPDRFPK